MYFTRDELFNLPDGVYGNTYATISAYISVGTLCRAVYDRYHCSISEETAARVIHDRATAK